MADGKREEGSAVVVASPSSVAMARATRGGNPLEELSTRVKAVEAGFRAWMAKQPIQIEAAVSTAVGAVQGGALGGLMGSLTADGGSPFPMPQTPPNADPQAMASLKQAQCSMAAAFGSGALFSIVSGMGTPNPAVNAITTGVAFAVFQGGFFMIGQKFSKPKTEDTNYSRTRSMLQQLGLQKYEKNFKNGLLTDQTLPLLTDSALRDVKIPPGPRLLIIDQIRRDPELVQSK
ncbi:hypothetical protein PR202_ga01557 [Eleusine coracana subsp. coracana]|uniref:SAM domain-containing protein n=1 Tax=Eleusine coracana subsp. coracana TaxID=191504 RepID=A0AAV5BHR5_ELECO|nr:hypothetical protein PR202_ga00870 [Eleusine coracana subsp. coracana]GJM85761.1 hypothetical protein PR202_ga01557 [Eleusine coracana subsp. coracana]